jgi:DNA-binding MurR/RpiR family transcriptional regulator
MFRETITRHFQSLSPSFQQIADFLLTSHQRAAFMSASRLAKHVGVDVATVTRFAQHLGYDGYVQLHREVQEEVLEELREARAPLKERRQTARGPLAQTLWQDWENLEKTIRNIPAQDATAALAAIRVARRIYLVSEAAGAGLALAMASYLRVVKSDVIVLAQGPFDSALVLKDLRAEDVVIGIGFTSYAYAAAQALKLGREVGAKTIGVIAQPDCPIGGVAEFLFSCSATEEGYLPSLTGISAILFALFYSLVRDDAEAYDRALMRFQTTYGKLTEGTARGDDRMVGNAREQS